MPLGPRPDSQAPKAPSWVGFVSSLLVLGGVFFFINSACSRGGSEHCVASTVPRAGASIAIVTPLDGAIISGPSSQSKVPVPVTFSASGVGVAAASHCEDGTGHFRLKIEPVSRPDCGPPREVEFRELTDGNLEITLLLAPGAYTLTAQLTNSESQPFVGLVAVTHITVVGEQSAAGSPACP